MKKKKSLEIFFHYWRNKYLLYTLECKVRILHSPIIKLIKFVSLLFIFTCFKKYRVQLIYIIYHSVLYHQFTLIARILISRIQLKWSAWHTCCILYFILSLRYRLYNKILGFRQFQFFFCFSEVPAYYNRLEGVEFTSPSFGIYDLGKRKPKFRMFEFGFSKWGKPSSEYLNLLFLISKSEKWIRRYLGTRNCKSRIKLRLGTKVDLFKSTIRYLIV